MSALSVKIEDMKTMSWPMAVVISAVVVVIGVLAFVGKDFKAVSDAILFILFALGYAELREIKAQTNGSSTAKDVELANYRRQQEALVQKLLEAQPIIPQNDPK